MRRVLVVGLTGLFLLSAAAVTGCDSGKKDSIPDKMIELPKEGPKAAGAPAGGAPAKGSQPAQSAQ
jgi:hypothetical protein